MYQPIEFVLILSSRNRGSHSPFEGWPPRSSSRENHEIFYLLHIVEYANFEFIFAIRVSKWARRSVVDNIFKHKIGGLFLYAMTLEGWARGSVHSNSSEKEIFSEIEMLVREKGPEPMGAVRGCNPSFLVCEACTAKSRRTSFIEVVSQSSQNQWQWSCQAKRIGKSVKGWKYIGQGMKLQSKKIKNCWKKTFCNPIFLPSEHKNDTCKTLEVGWSRNNEKPVTKSYVSNL